MFKEIVPRGIIIEDFGGYDLPSDYKWDPILISLLRRALPDIPAHQLCNVQPMLGLGKPVIDEDKHYYAHFDFNDPVALKAHQKKMCRERIMHNKELMAQPVKRPDPLRVGLVKGWRRELDISKQINCIEIVRDESFVEPTKRTIWDFIPMIHT